MAFSRTALVIASAGVLLLSGCDLASETRLDFTDTEAVKITQIAVGRGSGDVVVRTANIAEVRIKRVVWFRGDEPQSTYAVTGTTLTVDRRCGPQCSVDYDIEAPAGVVVRGADLGSGDLALTNVGGADLRLGSGNVTISGGSGRMAAETGSGNITATDVHGEARLITGSGTIEGQRVGGGALWVQSGSGEIRLTLDQAGPVRAHTDSCEVHVTVPTGSYRVRADTGSGERVVQVPNSPDGKHLLDVGTGSGDLTLTTG